MTSGRVAGSVDARPWPNLFLVGAAKAGTTSLWEYLSAHPDVFMSPIKEPHFFSRGGVPGLPVVKEERAYRAMFAAGVDATYRGDASVSYLWDADSPGAIAAVAPDARILISLRDPVERAYSHYLTYVRLGLDDRPFDVAVRQELDGVVDIAATPPPYVARGTYPEQVERYLSRFGDRVHVLFFDDLAADIRETMRRVFEWLELDPGVARAIEPVRHNAFVRPRHRLATTLARLHAMRHVEPLLFTSAKPPLDAATRGLLEATYAGDAARLSILLGRPLPWQSSAEAA